MKIDVTSANLTSSTAPALLAGQVEWTASTAYSAGSIVARSTRGKLYRAVYDIASTATQAPEDDIAKSTIPKWQDYGPMNQVAVFDTRVTTKTVGPAGVDLVMAMTPGATNTVWVGGIESATSVRVLVKDAPGGNVVFDQTASLHRPIGSWYDWWFAPFQERIDALFTGIPAYNKGEVTVTLATTATAKVGMIAPGTIESLGITLESPEVTGHDYTTQTNSAWGPTAPSGGLVAKNPTYRVFVAPEDAPRVDRFMTQAMTSAVVWIPSDEDVYEGLRIFGQAAQGSQMTYTSFGIVDLTVVVDGFV